MTQHVDLGNHAYSEILRLSEFLIKNYGSEVRPGEEAVDGAIRIMRRQLTTNASAPPPQITACGYTDQLMQVFSATTRDGELICKEHRDRLAHEGLVGQSRGWNFITARGVEALVQLGLVRR